MTSDPAVADLRAIPVEDFSARFRCLGAHGVLASLRETKTLAAGCERLERIAYDLDSLGIFISVISAGGLALPILDAAASPVAGKIADEVSAGRSVVAVAITEPDAGSDVLGMRTVLENHGTGLRLRGRKWTITNAPVADHLIVFCQNSTSSQRFLTAVLVPASALGAGSTPAQRLAGAHGSPTGEVLLRDVPIEPEWILGAPDDGKRLLDLAFIRERVLAPWPLIGAMSRALQNGVDHVERRVQFGRPIKEQQYVQEKIVSAFEEIEATRLIAELALELHVSGRPCQLHASLAKYRAAESAARVFKAMIEVHGSYGVQRESGLAEHLVDSVCASIAGGTREMHKKVVFDQLALDRARARRSGHSRIFRTTHATGETKAR